MQNYFIILSSGYFNLNINIILILLSKNMWFDVPFTTWIKYYGEHYCLKGRKVFPWNFSLLALWIMNLMHAYIHAHAVTMCFTATEKYIMGCKCSRSVLFFASIFMWDVCFYVLSLFLFFSYFGVNVRFMHLQWSVMFF